MIKNYLVSNKKPDAITDLVQNLNGQVTRTEALRALEVLLGQDYITSKTFGKIVIYSRKDIPINFENEFKDVEDVDQYSYDILVQLNEESMELEREKGAAKKELDDTLRHPTNAQIEDDIARYTTEIEQLEKNIQELSQESTTNNKEDCEQLSKQLSSLEKETKSRRKIFQNIKGILVEQVGHKAISELLEDLGVTTI